MYAQKPFQACMTRATNNAGKTKQMTQAAQPSPSGPQDRFN